MARDIFKNNDNSQLWKCSTTVTKHSELNPEVPNAVNRSTSFEMSENVKSESMLLSKKSVG